MISCFSINNRSICCLCFLLLYVVVSLLKLFAVTLAVLSLYLWLDLIEIIHPECYVRLPLSWTFPRRRRVRNHPCSALRTFGLQRVDQIVRKQLIKRLLLVGRPACWTGGKERMCVKPHALIAPSRRCQDEPRDHPKITYQLLPCLYAFPNTVLPSLFIAVIGLPPRSDDSVNPFNEVFQGYADSLHQEELAHQVLRRRSS